MPYRQPVSRRSELGQHLETETEDEHNPLPTSRIASPPASVYSWSGSAILPWLFQLCRFLSIVPATTATLVHGMHLLDPPNSGSNGRVEYSLCILWALLTARQCFSLTSGLLNRWRVYYSPLPTLIRLLALQAICWPATHYTLRLFDHDKRPLVCWAAIGSTTCFSKAIEMWVTSNLWLLPKGERGWSVKGMAVWAVGELGQRPNTSGSAGLRSDAMGNTKGRRWNWSRVLVTCVAPPGFIYVIMAWALLLKREFE